jgi:hypothetical protein
MICAPRVPLLPTGSHQYPVGKTSTHRFYHVLAFCQSEFSLPGRTLFGCEDNTIFDTQYRALD